MKPTERACDRHFLTFGILEDCPMCEKEKLDTDALQQRLLDANRAENDGKADAGKVRACFPIDYFPRALEAVARICEDGEKEYGYGTWSSVPDALRRYREAAMRHRLAIGRGEIFDSKSGTPHSWHIAWNALAIVELEERER